MNREERRRSGLRGVWTRVTCLRVEPTSGGEWEVSYAVHPGWDVHDTAVCNGERQVLVVLVEDEGVCMVCRSPGLVLRERKAGAVVACAACVLVNGQRLVTEAVRAMESARNGMWEN